MIITEENKNCVTDVTDLNHVQQKLIEHKEMLDLLLLIENYMETNILVQTFGVIYLREQIQKMKIKVGYDGNCKS